MPHGKIEKQQIENQHCSEKTDVLLRSFDSLMAHKDTGQRLLERGRENGGRTQQVCRCRVVSLL